MEAHAPSLSISVSHECLHVLLTYVVMATFVVVKCPPYVAFLQSRPYWRSRSLSTSLRLDAGG